MKPMLAHTYEPHRFAPCYVQPKFDGIRALYQSGHFQSRDELPMSTAVLRHLSEPLREMFPDDRIILDGELYVHGWPLGRINGAVTPVRLEPTEDSLQVEYYVFDRVQYNTPFINRFLSIHETIVTLGPDKGIQPVTTMSAPTEADADKFYAFCVDNGFEGIMYRIGDCPYTVPKQPLPIGAWGRSKFLSDKNNRTWHLLKRKDWQDGEFMCIDYNLTTGEKGEEGFQMYLETLAGRTFKCGSGLTATEREQYAAQSPIGKRFKVKFRCWTADRIPFNPTIICQL